MNGLRRWMRDQMNPLRKDPEWLRLDRLEREAKSKHLASRPHYQAKRQRLHSLLGSK